MPGDDIVQVVGDAQAVRLNLPGSPLPGELMLHGRQVLRGLLRKPVVTHLPRPGQRGEDDDHDDHHREHHRRGPRHCRDGGGEEHRAEHHRDHQAHDGGRPRSLLLPRATGAHSASTIKT